MSEHAENDAVGSDASPPLAGEGSGGEEKSAIPAPDEAQGLQEELRQARSEVESQGRRLDEIARAYSALLNDQKEFRARIEREKERVLESERAKIVLNLLQVGDEIERALQTAQDDRGPLAQGIRLIHEGLGRTLSSMGIERLALIGQPYDPNLAEVLDVTPVQDSGTDGQVVGEITPGFKLGSRVLRPARVRVARFVPSEAPCSAPPGNGVGAASEGDQTH